MRSSLAIFPALGVLIAMTAPASASETIEYTYDAKGRLVKVERSGSINDGAKTEYQHDKVDNRKKVKTTGSPNNPS